MSSLTEKSALEEEKDIIDRFTVAYNRIETSLRNFYGKEEHTPFVLLIDLHAGRFQHVDDTWLLHEARKIRNILTHNRLSRGPCFAVPTDAIVVHLERIAHYLEHPVKAVTCFRGNVTTVEPSTSLATVCRLIATKDFSQFPVYTGTQFSGLLTENGITRWLSSHVSERLSLIELEEITTAQVLSMEETRENWLFVGRDALVADIRELFATKRFLEAVLISQSGKPSEKPLGIATRWDLTEMQDTVGT